jgi:hypothetical protein
LAPPPATGADDDDGLIALELGELGVELGLVVFALDGVAVGRDRARDRMRGELLLDLDVDDRDRLLAVEHALEGRGRDVVVAVLGVGPDDGRGVLLVLLILLVRLRVRIRDGLGRAGQGAEAEEGEGESEGESLHGEILGRDRVYAGLFRPQSWSKPEPEATDTCVGKAPVTSASQPLHCKESQHERSRR